MEGKDVRDGENEEDGLAPVAGKENLKVKLKVLFFARARDITGMNELPLEISSGSTASDCFNEVIARFPGLQEIRKCTVLAVNEEYASEYVLVKDRDELAIIPPISGG